MNYATAIDAIVGEQIVKSTRLGAALRGLRAAAVEDAVVREHENRRAVDPVGPDANNGTIRRP